MRRPLMRMSAGSSCRVLSSMPDPAPRARTSRTSSWVWPSSTLSETGMSMTRSREAVGRVSACMFLLQVSGDGDSGLLGLARDASHKFGFFAEPDGGVLAFLVVEHEDVADTQALEIAQ